MNEQSRKAMTEKRASIIEEMTTLTNTAEAETRAFTEEEQTSFDALAKEVEGIDATMKAAEETRALSDKVIVEVKQETQEEIDTRTFASIIRERADSNITKSDNGAVIPTTIAQKIIDKIVDLSPVFGSAEKYNITGNVAIPYVDGENDNIAVEYADEFNELEAKSTRLKTITLSGHLTGVLTKISRSLINNTDLNITNLAIDKIAQACAQFIDREVLVGTPDKITGLSELTQKVQSGSTSAITMDEIITLKDRLKTPFQRNAYFVMHPETLDMIRHLKDGENRYYVNDDLTTDFGVRLLGKPVYTSDMMPEIDAGATAIYYGDFRQALAAKIVEKSMQILNEKYATQHAIGIVSWMELDCKIQNQQAVTALVMKAS